MKFIFGFSSFYSLMTQFHIFSGSMIISTRHTATATVCTSTTTTAAAETRQETEGANGKKLLTLTICIQLNLFLQEKYM